MEKYIQYLYLQDKFTQDKITLPYAGTLLQLHMHLQQKVKVNKFTYKGV